VTLEVLLSKKNILAAALAASLIGAALIVQVALAHSRPIRFEPAPGAVLTTAPPKVDGWFTNEIRRDPNWSFIQVADDKGSRVDTGDSALSSDRRQMTATLKSGLAPGRYVVTWRTYDDADGAIFGDCYAFFVGQSAADAAVTAKSRLDTGGTCARIDVSAKDGTPAPGTTPAASSGTSDTADEGGTQAGTSNDDGGGVAVWILVVGIAGGFLGGAGGTWLLKGRSAS
jgi:methionine-rich copper-binding protein CopC